MASGCTFVAYILCSLKSPARRPIPLCVSRLRSGLGSRSRRNACVCVFSCCGITSQKPNLMSSVSAPKSTPSADGLDSGGAEDKRATTGVTSMGSQPSSSLWPWGNTCVSNSAQHVKDRVTSEPRSLRRIGKFRHGEISKTDAQGIMVTVFSALSNKMQQQPQPTMDTKGDSVSSSALRWPLPSTSEVDDGTSLGVSQKASGTRLFSCGEIRWCFGQGK